ncbi:MAG: hypothetical protein WB711_17940 [Terriglobales bacterium]
MKNTFICKILTLAVVAVVSLSATSALAQGASDAFNRANLGTNWVVVAGGLTISNHELVGTTSESLGYRKNVGTKAASAVVKLGGTDLEYGAVAVGNIASGNNAFVKIQEEDGDGVFEYGAFYTGNNGSGTFFALSSTVPSPAILDVFNCGTATIMRITSAAGVQTYSNNYGKTFGTGAGLGTYGSVGLDNFISFPTGCNDLLRDAIPVSQMPRGIDLSLVK